MDFAETRDKGHGRTKVRRCWTADAGERVSQRAQWKKLNSVVLIESERTVAGKTTLEQGVLHDPVMAV